MYIVGICFFLYMRIVIFTASAAVSRIVNAISLGLFSRFPKDLVLPFHVHMAYATVPEVFSLTLCFGGHCHTFFSSPSCGIRRRCPYHFKLFCSILSIIVSPTFILAATSSQKIYFCCFQLQSIPFRHFHVSASDTEVCL